ncbi:MAG: FAD:protein FMN transferase, partial [Pseudomonadales bacterium]|nr:FAD:protein FMN transferase [Pseudomonadales bacterium]
ELIGKGKNNENKPWQIGIEQPRTMQRSIQTIINLSDTAMATSGDYRNYFEKDGKRYSHTIDPATGYPIQHRLASVTVIHKSCAYADAFATALSVLGPDKGFELAVELDLAVYMLVKKPGDDSGFEVLQTESFAPYVDQSAI